MCVASRPQKNLVQSLTAAQDAALPLHLTQRYSIPGAECMSPQNSVCFGPVYGDEPVDDVRHIPDRHDQVIPVADEPSGCDIPNVGKRKDISSMEDECRFNAGNIGKIRQLSEDYSHWRPIRGDGNCYYRTVIYGALESLLANRDMRRYRKLVGRFQQVRYELPAEQRAHEQMLERMRSWDSIEQLERWVSLDAGLDQALIRSCRRLVRLFLLRHADLPSPSGMTYSELVCALDTAYSCIEDFCAHVVDPMGRDAETLTLLALPQQLGIGLCLWILDRRDEVGLVKIETPGPDDKVDVHVLFKPGHYDLLYAKVIGEKEPLEAPRDDVTISTASSADESAGGGSPALLGRIPFSKAQKIA